MKKKIAKQSGNGQHTGGGTNGSAILLDSVECARAVNLRYVRDTLPGIRRIANGHGFRYLADTGEPVGDVAVRQRIYELAIPPAWKDVWICSLPNGHLQATGRDARGRKQYRYHVRWRNVRAETKYDRMLAFGKVLPKLRRRIAHDLALPGLPREKVLATIVRLLETTLIRVGNDEYARQNHSFGLTTLRNRHVAIAGSTIRFEFQGKSGIKHVIDVNNKRLARILRRCQCLAGQELFQYLDEEGGRQPIDSGDVNAYLREATGEEFTAKDFRTWAGTVLAAWTLGQMSPFTSQRQAKRNLNAAIDAVAKKLGNTRAVCRKSYVHAVIVDAYLAGSVSAAALGQEQKPKRRGLLPAEALVIELLRGLKR